MYTFSFYILYILVLVNLGYKHLFHGSVAVG